MVLEIYKPNIKELYFIYILENKILNNVTRGYVEKEPVRGLSREVLRWI